MLCVGEANVDLILSGVDRVPSFGEEVLAGGMGLHLGGSTANAAAFAARLGMSAALLARVGADDLGEFLIEELLKVGVDTRLIIRDDTLSSGVTVSLSGPRDRAFVTYVGTIDSLTAHDITDDLLARARHVHVGSYFLQRRLQPALPEILRRARRLGVTTSLDTGYDPSERWDSGLRAALESVDIFFPNEVEAVAITGAQDPVEGARGLSDIAGRVALKLGAEGSILFHQGAQIAAPAYPVDVVDTTCCGDAFNAGFLCAMLDGLAPLEMLQWGNAAGAIVAGDSGAAAGRLSRSAIHAIIAAR